MKHSFPLRDTCHTHIHAYMQHTLSAASRTAGILSCSPCTKICCSCVKWGRICSPRVSVSEVNTTMAASRCSPCWLWLSWSMQSKSSGHCPAGNANFAIELTTSAMLRLTRCSGSCASMCSKPCFRVSCCAASSMDQCRTHFLRAKTAASCRICRFFCCCTSAYEKMRWRSGCMLFEKTMAQLVKRPWLNLWKCQTTTKKKGANHHLYIFDTLFIYLWQCRGSRALKKCRGGWRKLWKFLEPQLCNLDRFIVWKQQLPKNRFDFLRRRRYSHFNLSYCFTVFVASKSFSLHKVQRRVVFVGNHLQWLTHSHRHWVRKRRWQIDEATHVAMCMCMYAC